jgi:CRISPR-associated endonuclease Cas3-HD
MPKIDETTRQQRLERISLLLMRNARGLTEGEIADEMRMERRSVNNYLRELELQGRAFKDGLYWFPLVLKESKLRSFDLSPEEAVTLYLGARLLAKQQDKRNEPAETALLKLASVLKADAGIGAEIEQAARELANRPVQKEYQPIFRDVVRGYIYGKKIELAYRPLNWNKSFQTTFSTYLLEPSPIGFTTYLIGHSSIVNAQRAYKLERIESVRMTKDDYSVPPDFPGLQILRNAWSIVMGEEKVRVVLRFSERVKARVLETIWHSSQQTHDDPEKPGCLLWEVQVADTLDLLPWIRSWGADAEVLEPEGLRDELMKETKRLTRIYNISLAQVENQDRILRLWGKTRKGGNKPEDFHPAIFHMLDVGNVARELLAEGASPRWRQILARAFNCEGNILSNWLPYFVALHDIGKVSAAFQALNKQQLMRLKQEGFELETIDIPHSQISQIYMEDTLAQVLATDLIKAQVFSEALGGHHGRFAHPDNDIKSGRRKLNREIEHWGSLRQKTDSILKEEFLKVDLNSMPSPTNISTAIMAFTGFVILCDWLGSDERYFKISPNIDLSSYLEKSRQCGKQATTDSGMKAITLSNTGTKAETLFADLVPLRALQLAIDDIPEELLHFPSLTIIEAPTGEGKTEAALALAHRIAQLNGT